MRDDNYDRRTDVSKCWYRNMCELFGTPECDYTCKKFTQTDYLFQLSNLPASCWKSQKLDMSFLAPESSDTLSMILNDIEFFVKKGFNLYLYGPTGCGKSSWAIKLMNNFFATIAEHNDFQTRGLYISVASFLRDSKLNMTYKNEDFYDLLRTIQTCDIVIWDDIAQTEATTYESQWLYSYINERILAKKCNIYTSNLSPDKLEKQDKRLHSRICIGSDCVCIDGFDRRIDNTYTAYINSEDEANGTATDY